MMKKKSLLIVAGLLVISTSMILGHYHQLLTDTTDGLMKGLGIGMLIVALLYKRKQSLKKRTA